MNRFSAAAGGSLCTACPGESMRIAPESLAAMSFLLEHPLTQATDIDPDGATIRDIWHCIREICRYHVGSNLKVEPWSYPPAARNSS
jgi:hypothetical protein